jgi:hypothetical protein
MTQAYNLSQLANFVNTSGQLNATTGLYNTSSLGFPSTTRMSFNQTAAPTGWTKDTSATINDSILRLVTGSVSSGGTVAFSTWNSSGSTGATTLSIAQIPSHTHTAPTIYTDGATNVAFASPKMVYPSAGNTGSEGGGGSHTHTFSNDVKYYDFIIASKD